MNSLLSQISHGLLFPPNVMLATFVLAVLLVFLKRKFLAGLTFTLGFLWMLAWSLPITTLAAGGWLENRYTFQPELETSTVDAIVVLGGHVQGNRVNWFEPFDESAVVSRESLAASLYLAERAPLIVLSGGALEGNISDTATMARSLRQLGIPADAIIEETQSQNTRENATLTDQTLRSLKKKRLLLVTSALHMPRAMAAFDSTSVQATAAPLPAQIQWKSNFNRSPWQPDMQTLLASRSIIKEYAGLLLYWIQSLFSGNPDDSIS
jgi:uncharacterized SAM-binding protein YcdF (DUF218 family)